jgi:hypothetical protein
MSQRPDETAPVEPVPDLPPVRCPVCGHKLFHGVLGPGSHIAIPCGRAGGKRRCVHRSPMNPVQIVT